MTGVRDWVWRWAGSTVFALSPKPSYRFRARLLRLFGARVDPDARFRASVVIERPWLVRAGPRTMFGDDVVIWGDGEVRVGARTTISQMCRVCTSRLREAADGRGSVESGNVEIGEDCWVAADTLVLPGALVGRGALVGARSTIEGEIEPWRIASGEPARARGRRFLRGVSPDETAA
jgi:putative colanic acid biosynthesis acetyltransferase WcaF